MAKDLRDMGLSHPTLELWEIYEAALRHSKAPEGALIPEIAADVEGIDAETISTILGEHFFAKAHVPDGNVPGKKNEIMLQFYTNILRNLPRHGEEFIDKHGQEAYQDFQNQPLLAGR